MQGMGQERLPKIARQASWANKAKGRRPIEWGTVVECEWRGLEIDQEDALATESLGGFKEKISEAKEKI